MKQSSQPNGMLRRLVREAKPIRWWLLLSALLSCLAVLCSIAAPKLIGTLVQQLYDYWSGSREGSLRSSLLPGAAVLISVYAVYGLLSYGNMQLLNRVVSNHFTCGLRIRISDKIQRLPVRYVDQTPVGDILSRMTDDVSTMGNYVHQIMDILIKGFVQILAISVMMFLEDWRLACIVILLTPLSIRLSSRIAAKGEKYFHQMFSQSGDLYSVVEEAFSNFATAKAYNLEQYTEEKHRDINLRLRDTSARATFMASIVMPLIAFTNALAYISINLAGGWLVVRRGLPVGVVVTIVLYAKQFSSPLEQIARGFGEINHVKAAAKRVFKILDMEEEPVSDGALATPVRGQVDFSHVDFSYTQETPLIQDLDLHVKPGQTVAIVGPTGAGKTTIVNLLMRFYDIQSGVIRIDGADTAAMDRSQVRSAFGMVLQDTWLFRGTIAENVAYGKPGASRAEIEAVCRAAYCDHFIRTMPDGYDTLIGEDTSNLSGGQKQLLTIARALLAGRPLLILDEATSNVDTRTELLIQKAMDTLTAGRTCFIIAHRLSTIEGADIILVLDHGKIVEKGTHASLLAKKGFYWQLYQSQYAAPAKEADIGTV